MAMSRGLCGQLVFALVRGRNWVWASVLLTMSLIPARTFGVGAVSTKAESERLVAAAAKAEMVGDTSRAFSQLHDAIRIDPENQLAHWQLGEVQIDNKWMTAEEAQRRASVDPRQAEYKERRKAAGQSLQEQLALARWCRKSNLSDEAQFHWATVLAVDSKNEEALRALNLRWHKGQLVQRGQAADAKDQLRDAKRAAERWSSKTVKWRREVTGPDMNGRLEALAEIRAIKETDAIRTFEDVTLGRDANDSRHAEECAAIGLAFVEALGKMQAQVSTDSLARHAVFAPSEKVRLAATEKLKPRDRHDFVPMLVDALGMPIETSYSVTTGPDGSTHYLRSLYREGADSDWSWESRRAAVQRDLGGRHVQVDAYTGKAKDFGLSESPLVTAAKKANVASAYQNRYVASAAATEIQVQRANQSVETLNSRIVPVLTATTGKDLGDNPKAWWDWWRNTNEYASDDHPVDRHYDSGVDQYYYGFPTYSLVSSAPPLPLPPGRHSCFVKGTTVWTKTGFHPIETVEIGDLVLSQNVITGELKYQPVIGRTVRPPSPIVRLAIEKEDICTTRGHLFWVAGTGWRMAKELEKDVVLHGLNGGSRIRSIESVGEAEAYNLIVAEFNTFFVGECGVLVHDNKPRTPTQSIVPGVVATN
jgi:pretoxin HINT domain-containing protein